MKSVGELLQSSEIAPELLMQSRKERGYEKTHIVIVADLNDRFIGNGRNLLYVAEPHSRAHRTDHPNA